MKFQVMKVNDDGSLNTVVPVKCTIFENEHDAESLAYELSKATKEVYIVREILRSR